MEYKPSFGYSGWNLAMANHGGPNKTKELMSKMIGSRIIGIAALSAAAVGSLSAQGGPPPLLPRSYVTATNLGYDANTCASNNPCRTFAGAMAKTMAGGEVDALDAGDFGVLNITKAITIEGTGTNGSILADGVDGIVVNAGPNDVVVLRNISVNGASTSTPGDTRGIKFVSGKTLTVDGCEISNFGKRNISIESSTPNATALISNSIIHDGLNNGIAVVPPVGIMNQVILENVQSTGNAGFGVAVGVGGAAQVRHSVLGNNAGGGLWGGGSIIDVKTSLISGNLVGIQALSGSTVRVSDSTVVSNGTGLMGSTIWSYGNNEVSGNGSGNGPIANTVAKQ